MWRARWEQAREPVWKEKLLTYNAEDCAALRKVAEFVQAVGEAARSRGERGDGRPGGPAVAWADEIAVPSSRREWCRPKFTLEDFDHVNRCAYFDYQREKVFLRTSEVGQEGLPGAPGSGGNGSSCRPTGRSRSRATPAPAAGGTRLTATRPQEPSPSSPTT